MMFNKMQKLPISYFDQNNSGDIMSHYTNDTDALRQLISNSLTALVQSVFMLVQTTNVIQLAPYRWTPYPQ